MSPCSTPCLQQRGRPKWGSQQGGCRTPAGACGHARIRAFGAAATPWCNCLRGWMRGSPRSGRNPWLSTVNPRCPYLSPPNELILPPKPPEERNQHSAPPHAATGPWSRKRRRGRRAPQGRSVQPLGLAHGRLDVEAAHVLPVLLQQRHQEVDGHLGGATAPRQPPTGPNRPLAMPCKQTNNDPHMKKPACSSLALSNAAAGTGRGAAPRRHSVEPTDGARGGRRACVFT